MLDPDDFNVYVSKDSRSVLPGLREDMRRYADAVVDLDDRQGRVVELRFFGGLSVADTAAVLGISSETVMRDCKVARAWLMREMKK